MREVWGVRSVVGLRICLEVCWLLSCVGSSTWWDASWIVLQVGLRCLGAMLCVVLRNLRCDVKLCFAMAVGLLYGVLPDFGLRCLIGFAMFVLFSFACLICDV